MKPRKTRNQTGKLELELKAHKEFIKLCQNEGGITINGVEAKILPGKGVGLVANRRICQDEELIHIPASQIVTIDYDIGDEGTSLVNGLHDSLSVHGQLAVLLIFPPLSDVRFAIHRLWLDVLPSLRSLESCMPHFWKRIGIDADHTKPWKDDTCPDSIQNLLPPQSAKFDRDYITFKKKLASYFAEQTGLSEEAVAGKFTRGWFLVNSRSFFWDYPIPRDLGKNTSDSLKSSDGNVRKRRKLNPSARLGPIAQLPAEDCMALCPVMDYLNHSDSEGCEATFNSGGYTLKAKRDHEPNEELTVSYGKHNNDFLLVEYGFALSENPSDSMSIDHLILPDLSEEKKEFLREYNLYGNYTLLTSGEVCHRTNCAVRLNHIPRHDWQSFVTGELDEATGARDAAKEIHVKFADYIPAIKAKLNTLSAENVSLRPSAVITLQLRWQQIDAMVQRGIDHHQSIEHQLPLNSEV